MPKGDNPNSRAKLKPIQPGQTLNPGGRPKGSVTSLWRKLNAEVDPEDEHGRTRAEVLYFKAYELALKGDARAIALINDRVDGRPRQTVSVSLDARQRAEDRAARLVAKAAEEKRTVTRLEALALLAEEGDEERRRFLMTSPDSPREYARGLVLAAGVMRESVSPVGDGGDDAIRAALRECLAAPSLIPEEAARWRAMAATAENEVERAAYLWQAEKTRLQIEQAAEVAQERLRLLDSLKSEEDFEREREKCRAQTLYWFRMYAWGYDPRATLKVVPFYPFPRQEDYILWLDETVLVRRKSGVVEKARDMGATVGALDWAAHKWLFMPGFSAFLVSATDDLVDSGKDPDTLFEKVRFQLRLTPSWMLPEGFNLARDMPHMKIVNPKTGATITGGAPTENVGRQRRATVVLADEFQGWPNGGFKQNTALSQTSPSVLKLGTPYGKLNQYYKDTHADGANVFVMDWREHPWKSEAWYESLPFGYLSSRMTPEEIAQEVDRNYEASQPGRVWPASVFRETHVVITVSELRAFYARYGGVVPDGGDGRPRLPLEFGLGRANDKGHTGG